LLAAQCTKCTDVCTDGTFGSSDGGFSCFLASLPYFFASLIVVASMGPRYVYKDMLDNLVSPIACVSMNHQIQLEQMANGVMFGTHVIPLGLKRSNLGNEDSLSTIASC
jgi:hypothetical protein